MKFLDRLRGDPRERIEERLFKSCGLEKFLETNEKLDGVCKEIDQCIADMYWVHESPVMDEDSIQKIEDARLRKLELERLYADVLREYLKPYLLLDKQLRSNERLKKQISSSNFTDVGWSRMRSALSWGVTIGEDWRDKWQAGSQRKDQ